MTSDADHQLQQQLQQDGEEEGEEWTRLFPPYRSEETEQIDEFAILHEQIVPNRIVPCCVNCAQIMEVSALAVAKLNTDRIGHGMPSFSLVKTINATRQSVAGTAYRVQILLKQAKVQQQQVNCEEQSLPQSCPIYFFDIYRNIENIIDIKYEEICPFTESPGGQWRLSDGNFMPKIGLQCSPSWTELEAEQWIMVALELGIRLFDTSFFGHNRGQIAKAIKKFLPLFGLCRTDVFISAKINIVRPDSAKRLFMASPGIDTHQFHSVSDYAHFSVQQCIDQFDGYIDLCMVHYAKDACNGGSEPFRVSVTCTHNKSDREAVYGVLEHYRDVGTVRSIGLANFEPCHIDQLIKEGTHCVPAVVQCEMHPFLQRDDLLDYCKEHGIFVQAHSIFAYKNQIPSHTKQLQRYSLLKSVASFYKIGTSQLSLCYIVQCAPHVGAVFVENTDALFDTKKRVISCREIRKMLTRLISSVDDVSGIHLDEKHLRTIRTMELGKLGGGRFTDCEQWKVM